MGRIVREALINALAVLRAVQFGNIEYSVSESGTGYSFHKCPDCGFEDSHEIYCSLDAAIKQAEEALNV